MEFVSKYGEGGKEELIKNLSDDYVQEFLNLKENYMWRVSKARRDLMNVKNWEQHFTKILYRPFDIRHIFYHPSVVWRTRRNVMRHLMKDNLAICVGRAGHVVGADKPWNIVFCSEMIEDFNLFYRGGNVNFPLYIYSNQDKLLNINTALLKSLENIYGTTPLPEEILYYVYSILYSSFYREKYAEFLKTDFPRIPFTKDYKSFINIGKLGKKLVDLHLMKSVELSNPITKFQGSGDNAIERPVYIEDKERIRINKTQYFEGIEKDVWEYQIGGYQVLSKWLKDRKGRKLSLGDIKHYCKIATALKRTIDIQDEIDELYLDVENDVLEFKEKNENLEEYVK